MPFKLSSSVDRVNALLLEANGDDRQSLKATKSALVVTGVCICNWGHEGRRGRKSELCRGKMDL
jgi:hypothetical protein